MHSTIVIPVGVSAIALIIASVVLYRRRLLSVRYFVGWIAVGSSLAVGSLVLAFVHDPLDSAAITAILGSIALIILLGLLVQLSISVSGLQRQLREIAQAVALLRAGDPPS